MGKGHRRQFGQIESRQSTVRGRKPKYRPRYVGPDGHRYNGPPFATIGEAEGFLDGIEREIHLGLWEPPSPVDEPEPAETPTFAVYAEECIVGRMNRPVKPLRASTASNYRKQMRLESVPTTFGGEPIDRLTEDAVNAWHKTSSAKGHPTQTANAYLFFCSVMNQAVRSGLIPVSACKVLGAQGKPAPKHEAETLTIASRSCVTTCRPSQANTVYRSCWLRSARCDLVKYGGFGSGTST